MSHWNDELLTQEEFDREQRELQARAAAGWPPRTPPVATASFDDDPIERIAREIAGLSQGDAKKLLKVIEEKIG